MTRRRLVAGRLVLRALVSVAAITLPVAEACAQVVSSTPAATTAANGAPSPLFGLMQGVIGLVIVIGLIFAAGWLMKKVGPRASAGGLVQVVGGTSVGPREKVVVVRFNGRTLLLGVAPGRVSLLDATDTSDVVDASASASVPSPTFVDRLRAARGRA